MKPASRPDYILILILFILVIFGLIMVSSASVASSQGNFGDSYYYLKHQVFNGFIPGLISFLILQRIPYHYFKKWSVFLFVFNLLLLLLVLMVGEEYNGAKSWLRIGGFTFQPSEMVKLTFILYLATWFSSHEKTIKDWKETFLPFVTVMGLLVMLLLLQPDIGTLGMIIMPALAMYFLAKGNLKHLFLIIVAGAGGVFLLVKMAPYRLNRLLVFLNPQIDPLGIGYQINQALLAVGSGGILGLGLGRSRQKFNYLPEVQGDSIFAIIAEELGLIGALLLVSLFVFLLWRCFQIARGMPDRFSQLTIYGIASWITIQALVNIGANLSLLPLTGVPLPFISYGGTALALAMAAMGIVVNISKYRNT